jgi:hypothetical protein
MIPQQTGPFYYLFTEEEEKAIAEAMELNERPEATSPPPTPQNTNNGQINSVREDFERATIIPQTPESEMPKEDDETEELTESEENILKSWEENQARRHKQRLDQFKKEYQAKMFKGVFNHWKPPKPKKS